MQIFANLSLSFVFDCAPALTEAINLRAISEVAVTGIPNAENLLA